MSEFRALVSLAVAGKGVRTGDTFEADDEAVADAVAAGLVEPVEHDDKPKRTTTRKKTS